MLSASISCVLRLPIFQSPRLSCVSSTPSASSVPLYCVVLISFAKTVGNYKCQCTLHPKSMPNTTSPPPSSIVRLHVLEILLRQSSRLRNASGMKGRGCGGRLERSATRLARRGAEGAGQPERSSARRAANGGEQEQRNEVEVSRGSTIPQCACRYFPIYQVFLLPLLLPEAS
ncbi:hypothetical protein B0H11DRAFT_2045758 [Mycena galericulata]|nr:hypothetical protein B0H11DRAFT_2045758 [Mycena galericulata]